MPSSADAELSRARRQPFRLLKINPRYRIYFVADCVAQLGFWIENTALLWLIMDLTHSGMSVGLLSFCQFAPLATLGLFGGVLVDRYDLRKILLIVQTGVALCPIALLVLAQTNRLDVHLIFAVATARGVLICFTIPAWQIFLIELVGKDSVSNAYCLSAAREHLARLVGPAIAGSAIVVAGVSVCFAASAAGALAMLYTACSFRMIRHRAAARRPLSPFSNFRDGLRAVLSDPSLRMLTLALFIVTFLPMSFVVTLPIFSVQTLKQGSIVYGLLFSSLGSGSLAAALLVASRRAISHCAIFASAAGLGIAELVLMFEREVLASAVVLAVAGFCMTYFLVSIRSILITEARDDMIGRISAIYTYIVMACGSLGNSLSGWLSEVGGTELSFGLGGFAALSIGCAGLLRIKMTNSRVVKRVD